MELAMFLCIAPIVYLTTYLLVPYARKCALCWGAIDKPDQRRVNRYAVPRCGGIALMGGVLVGFVMLNYLLVASGYANGLPIGIVVGTNALFAIGLWDDIIQLRPLRKLIGQIVASMCIVATGVCPSVTGVYQCDFVCAVGFLVVTVNAINLIDGLDGLASGVCSVIATGFLIVAAVHGLVVPFVLSMVMLAICGAFLLFNRYPARIFMGDSGSLLLGALVGVIALLEIAPMPQDPMNICSLMCMIGVPFCDIFTAVVRRMRRHQSIFKADTNHLHHCLLHAGYGPRQAVRYLVALSGVAVAAGCLLAFSNGFVCLFTLILYGILFGLVIEKTHVTDADTRAQRVSAVRGLSQQCMPLSSAHSTTPVHRRINAIIYCWLRWMCRSKNLQLHTAPDVVIKE
jgi:UDP-GlcNAc:undecaprenyl-phosphate GlcNAc-1-phosphate transferase